MIRLLSCVVLLWLISTGALSQITIYQDEKGQVYTKGSFNPRVYNPLPYLGSPFLTFPIWQPGKIRLDSHGQVLSCELAYNLVSNEVLCRFVGDSTVRTTTPESFTINGDEFVRQQDKLLGIDYRLYTIVIHEGQTKLMLSLTKRIDRYAGSNNGYTKEMEVAGQYTLLNQYYIRKGDAKPEFIVLTKNSLLAALYEQADKLADRLPGKRLTLEDVANTLVYYDSLMAIDWVNKPSLVSTVDSAQHGLTGYANEKPLLSNDPVFNQTLHHKISYPSQAWLQGIYGRIYAGFEVDQQGRIKNIVILSPENIGLGFIESVRNGLEKMPNLDPTFKGVYALPVTFTFANSREHTTAHRPISRLPADRLTGRTLLEEFVVPIVVTKPNLSSREVWGYYPEVEKTKL